MAFSLSDFAEPGDRITNFATGERYTLDRYWIHDSVVEDQPDVSMPFGEDTVGIVDEDEGGVAFYVHRDRADDLLAVLTAADRARV